MTNDHLNSGVGESYALNVAFIDLSLADYLLIERLENERINDLPNIDEVQLCKTH